MLPELEQRLRDEFAVLTPDVGVTKRARAAALGTLPTRRRVTPLAFVLAAVVAGAVTAGAAALAASGNLHVHLGARTTVAPRPLTHLAIPPRSNGIALVAGGRLWLATRSGLRIEGMPATTAELSPHALYAAVGIGSSLVALAPGERRAWTHPTGGSVAAAAWSPDGLKIAYVVNRHGAYDLRLIEGDGDHDRLLARRVAAVKPWWRRDSLALHYLLASGRRATLDFARGRRILGAVTSLPPAAASASSRLGREVAVATRSSRRIVELRIVRVPGPTPNRVLLRVPAGRTPLSVSWR